MNRRKKAIFLDIDGTLNYVTGRSRRPRIKRPSVSREGRVMPCCSVRAGR